MKVSLKTDTSKLRRIVKNEREVPYATKKALNTWMFETNKFLKKDIDNHLEGGAEEFTKSGLRIQKVKSKETLYGHMHLSLQSKKPYLDRYYLKNIVYGGKVIPPRPDRRKLMQPIPGKIKVNAKGNLTKKAYATLRAKENKYFYGIPKGRVGERFRGLWERTAKGMTMIVALGKESRQQEALFPVPKITKKRFEKKFPLFFAAEYRKIVMKNSKK